MERMKLSIAIITKNEELRIGQCLDSVGFADDIVVVDSGSTDRTVEIATARGARVFVEGWKGYGAQKNSSVAKCANEWVFILDADEVIPEQTRRRIAELVANSPEDVAAYSFRRKNYFHGRWMRFAGEWPDRQVRLVRRGRGAYEGAVHETWRAEGRIVEDPAHFDHFSYDSYSSRIRKMEEYSTIGAVELLKKGRRVGPWKPFLNGASMFLRTYFVNLGFLHGMDGFVVSMVKGLGSFFKYAKLLEMQKRQTT